MNRAAALVIGLLHAGAVAGLLAAATPAWRPATGERSPFGVFLIPMPAVTSDREPSAMAEPKRSSLCTRTVEIDERGALYEVGPPSRVFLRSLPAGSDGDFPVISVLCRPMFLWSKQMPHQPVNERPLMLQEPMDIPI